MLRHSGRYLVLMNMCQWRKSVLLCYEAFSPISRHSRHHFHSVYPSRCKLYNDKSVLLVFKWSPCTSYAKTESTFLKPILQDVTCATGFVTSGRGLHNKNGNGDKNGKSVSASNKKANEDPYSVFKALEVQPINDPDSINIGEELAGKLKKSEVTKILLKFHLEPKVREVAKENGIDNRMFMETFHSFKKFVTSSTTITPELHVIFSDLVHSAGHITDILPYFIQHSKSVFPHLDCMEDLQHIADLRNPANWYCAARAMQRKIVYHMGPTNSGKTFHALQRFYAADSAIYCSPLRLLANEVCKTSNDMGTPCDLVTGEERKLANEDGGPSTHISCTVEMMNLETQYDVVIIDEIQMLKESNRGWAWTRAFLGACAKEIHVCGEGSALELVKYIAEDTGDEVEVHKYKRLTPLMVLEEAVGNFSNIRPGDCIVCFNKNDIFFCTRKLEQLNVQSAVIYGSLPPGTKMAQSARFNDPNDPCNVMIATDAIGMGLNLNIKRIVFYSIMKATVNETGEKEFDVLSVSQAKQIAGRAGRYNSLYNDGEVTTFNAQDLPGLKSLLAEKTPDVEQAGLHPNAEQIEMFAFYLPKATFSNLIDIFVSVSQLDNKRYFMCNMVDFKALADMIEHIPLSLTQKYSLCCSPIDRKKTFLCSMFLKYARQICRAQPLTWNWITKHTGWPYSVPTSLKDLEHLEGVFDCLDLYLWLSFRFSDLFPDVVTVHEMQYELDCIIQTGIVNLTSLLNKNEKVNVQIKDILVPKPRSDSHGTKLKIDVPHWKEIMHNLKSTGEISEHAVSIIERNIGVVKGVKHPKEGKKKKVPTATLR